eukprot:3016593-Heterocapsa_arctica.AAC.1
MGRGVGRRAGDRRGGDRRGPRRHFDGDGSDGKEGVAIHPGDDRRGDPVPERADADDNQAAGPDAARPAAAAAAEGQAAGQSWP